MQRLISLVEVAVVAQMEKTTGAAARDADGSHEAAAAANEVMEDALKIIEPCQV